MSDELHAMATTRAESEYLLRPSTGAIEKIKFYAWGFWGVATGLVIATAFIVRLQIKIADFDLLAAKRQTQWDELYHWKSLIESNEQDFKNRQTTMADRNMATEQRLNVMEPKVNEMWFMKEHDINNDNHPKDPRFNN